MNKNTVCTMIKNLTPAQRDMLYTSLKATGDDRARAFLSIPAEDVPAIAEVLCAMSSRTEEASGTD